MAKPMEKVTLTYDGFFHLLKNEPENNPAITSVEWSQGITALLEPLPMFTTALRYQKRKQTQSETAERSTDFYSAVNYDEFVISLLSRHPGESRGPELVEFTVRLRRTAFAGMTNS
jgi:hypothetical protein